MPNLAREYTEDDDLSVEASNVYDLMDGFYELYCTMAGDPCFDDLAQDVAALINEIDQRRMLAAQVAADEEQGLQSRAIH